MATSPLVRVEELKQTESLGNDYSWVAIFDDDTALRRDHWVMALYVMQMPDTEHTVGTQRAP